MSSLLPKTIYCDEAGFTGNNLLAEAQPFFVFSSVVIEPEEAEEIVNRLIRDYRLQGNELKGNRVSRSNSVRRAAEWLIKNYAKYCCVAAYDKKYSLAGKFYEYIFEPVLASQNYLFYQTRFHRFISNLLYLEFFVRGAYAEEILSEFETAMRNLDFETIEKLLIPAGSDAQMSRFLRQILTFCFCHKEAIAQELKSLRETEGTGKWILELSNTALHSLLSKWGEVIDGMEVYCDASKPLTANNEFFDVMINREDKAYINIDGVEHPITYNLAGPIKLVDSESTPGIQIADMFASSIAFSLKNPDDPFSEKCQEFYEDIFHPFSVFPQLDYANLNEEHSFVNALILEELMRRTLIGEDLLDQMPIFIYGATQAHKQWLLEHQNSGDEENSS